MNWNVFHTKFFVVVSYLTVEQVFFCFLMCGYGGAFASCFPSVCMFCLTAFMSFFVVGLTVV